MTTHRTLGNLLRRVADTAWEEHTRQAIVATYGSSLLVEALNLGLVAAPHWRTRTTTIVGHGHLDITAAGEKLLRTYIDGEG